MVKLKYSAEASAERAAMAISVIRNHTDLLAKASEEMARCLDAMDNAFRVLRATDSSNEVRKLHARIFRLRELRNMMELGSYQITMQRAMDEVWRGLP